MRLVYFGSGAFGLPTLRRLLREHQVALVVTQPDRPAGRHRTLTPTPIADVAAAAAVPMLKPENVNDPAIVQQIRSTAADAWIVIAFGQKLGRDLLHNVFAINLHASLLPRYRGAAPIQWAIIHGERETGVSVIGITDRIDAGPIYAQASLAIHPLETAGELHDRLADLGPEVIAEVLARHATGRLIPQYQDERLACNAPKLSKADGTVRFDQPAAHVRQRIHGLTPWPGCTVRIDARTLRLHRVDVAEIRHQKSEVSGQVSKSHANEIKSISPGLCPGAGAGTIEPGTVLDDLSIACAPPEGGAIRLLEVQPSGARLMTFEQYCNGHPMLPGMRLEPL